MLKCLEERQFNVGLVLKIMEGKKSVQLSTI